MDLNWKNKLIFLLVFSIFLNCENTKPQAPWKMGLVALSLNGNDYYMDDPFEQYAGGDTTVFDTTENAFDLHATNLTDVTRTIDFQDGNANFNRNWVPAGNSTVAGLGPTFNNNSCQGCHMKDGRGRPPTDGTTLLSMLVRLSKKNEKDPLTGSVVGLEHFGNQLNTKGIVEYGTNIQIPHEGTVTITYQEIPGIFPDGETYSLRQPTYTIHWNVDGYSGSDPLKIHVPAPTNYDISPRVATMIPGLGLLEAVPEETLDSFVERQSATKVVSGRKNIVWDFANNKKAVGRFGWKANQPSLRQQNAGAFLGDMGLTTSLFPNENCPTGQTLCASSPSGGNPEISDPRLERVTFYTSLVGVPARRGWKNPDVREGKRLFIQIGCANCHIPRMKTSTHSIPEISNQEIRPYTDLLLHDMGEGLADERPDFEATGREWRTAPLWGIGLVETVNSHNFFLHDGRARGFQEAILWHGGEAEDAKEKYKQLSKKEREKILLFLKSL